MDLFVARHGEIDWNAVGRLCGRTDLPLNENGIAQARLLAEALIDSHATPDLVIASPLKRASQTAAIVADRLGIPMETDARLIEQSFGVYEGRSNRDPDFLKIKANFAVRYPGGESALQVGQRLYGFLDELRQREGLRCVLVVSHGSAIRVLNTYFEDMDNAAFLRWRMDNAALLRYTLAEGAGV